MIAPRLHMFAFYLLLYDYSLYCSEERLGSSAATAVTSSITYHQLSVFQILPKWLCGAHPFCLRLMSSTTHHSFVSGCFFLTCDLNPHHSSLLVEHAAILAALVRSIKKLIMHRHECFLPCRIHAGHLPTFWLFILLRSDVRYFDDALNSPLHTSLAATPPSLS